MGNQTLYLPVAGVCPCGCGETLYLGAGGHVTCSWIHCPNPAAADELLSSPTRQPEERS